MLVYNLVLKSVTSAGKMTCLVKNKDAYLILYYTNREEEEEKKKRRKKHIQSRLL